MPEKSALDEVIEYRDVQPPRAGLHTGVITNVIFLEKPPEKSEKTGELIPWLGIIVELTEVDLHGEKYQIKVDVTRSLKPGSNLRMIITALGFNPSPDAKFTLRQLVGVEVDVIVHHSKGENANYTFGNIKPDAVFARGDGAEKQMIAEMIVTSPRKFRRAR